MSLKSSMSVKISFLLIILMIFPIFLFSQQQAHYLKLKGSNLSFFKKQTRKLKQIRFDDHENLNLKLEQLRSYFHEKGYLETNIDSTYQKGDTLIAVFHIGQAYVWKHLNLFVDENTNTGKFVFKHIQFKGGSFDDRIGEQNKILDYCLNHAHPFASLTLSDLKIKDGEIRGTCLLNPNKRVVWDSMLTKGDVLIHPRFLENHLGIKPGRAYSESKFESIFHLVSKLDFVSEIKASELEFFDGTAKVYNYLKKRSANRFDGIVGFQNSKKTNKIELTGEVNLALVNSFHRGEHIQFKWQKLQESSQVLQIGFQYPYVFNSKLGTDFSFRFLKQDSSYVNTNLKIGLNFQQSTNSNLSLFYQLKASSLISTKQFAGVTVLPDFADSKSNLLGFEYRYEKLDRKYNPLKGWDLLFDVSGGENKITKNIKIPQNLYDNIDLKTQVFESKLNLRNYTTLVSKWVYHWQIMAAWMHRVNYFENDLYRLGGLKTIRGFNEDTFRASKYAIVKQEFRFVPNRNTSIYLFYDWAWYEKEIQENKISDKPMGYGFGFNFSAGSGLFSLNYALGKQKGESTDFKSAKIHFGFIAKF